MKTALFGIDGATFRVIEQNRDRLPFISNLIDEGSSGTLYSTLPSTTSVAWPSLCTGQNPSKYGIFDFLDRDLNTMSFEFNDARRIPMDFFWDFMDGSVGIYQVPMIPYHHIEGSFIQGSLSRINEDIITKPPELSQLIPEEFDQSMDWRDDEEEILEKLYDRLRAHKKVYSHVASNYEHELYFFMFGIVDHIQHHFWGYMDKTHPGYRPSEYEDEIVRMYSCVDDVIRKIVEQFDDEVNIVLVSDHGFMPSYTEVSINALLQDKGLLEYNVSESTELVTKLLNGIKQRLNRKSISKLVPKSLYEFAAENSALSPGENINWGQTTAYSFGSTPSVYINLTGREAYGTVDTSQYDEVVDHLAALFDSLEDPHTGEKVVKNVHRKTDIYSGSYIEKAPDIVLEPNDGFEIKGSAGTKSFSHNTEVMPNSGCHARDGIFIASGPGIRGSKISGGLELRDVAPLLLYLHGYTIPDRMDGQVPEGVVDRDEPPEIVTRTKPEKHIIKDNIARMKALGVV